MATEFRKSVADETSAVGSVLTDTTAQVKDQVSNLGRSAAGTIDENRAIAASGLDKAASALHDTAGNLPGGEKVSRLAHVTADTLTSTAGYVRDHDVNRMMADVGTLVKNNPGPSLLAAAAIGFLVGRAFSD